MDTTPIDPRERRREGRTLGNNPLELTSFVGRRSELSEVKTALSSSRLVALTGIGGVGKTRPALRMAGASSCVRLAPDPQLAQHRPDRAARSGKDVLVARWTLAVTATSDQSRLLQFA